jgi:murein DD-endopeptidase MepM/ murein hydrolase activator NlpD
MRDISFGNVVAVLGPKWRIHYYAHLKTSSVRQWEYVRRGQVIGAVGASGNARGKPPHLHFAVITIIPYVWRAERGPQGWKKMYFLDPDGFLTKPPGKGSSGMRIGLECRNAKTNHASLP